jgi:hypothetical protein
MKLQKISANETIITLENCLVLFSYNTPVAAIVRSTGEGYKTSKKWSKTTSKHINKFLYGQYPITEKPQEFFEKLIQ